MPARSSPRITDNLYVRVVDVEAALRARKYAAGVDLVIEVDDPILPANTGRYRIVTDGDPEGSTAQVTRVQSKPDLSMGILELGTIYLGGASLTAPAPCAPGHRAHPGRGRGRVDRLRLAPGAVLPRHVLTLGTPETRTRPQAVTSRPSAIRATGA